MYSHQNRLEIATRMRRKSERTAGKKSNASPEKKIDKSKRRSRRRKQSASSENESGDETTQVQEVEKTESAVQKSPTSPVKENSPEESQEQVWHVKKTDNAEDKGEIKKLKICLTRPPSTPERIDKSPRSKRKHSRATSSSDTPSNEGSEDRKRSKHRSKHNRESKDDTDKNVDSHDEEEDVDEQINNSENKVTQSVSENKNNTPTESPVSTTQEEVHSSKSTVDEECTTTQQISVDVSKPDSKSEVDPVDTTVISPNKKAEANSEQLDSTNKEKSIKDDKDAKQPTQEIVPTQDTHAKERNQKSPSKDTERSSGSMSSKESSSKVSISEDKSVNEEVVTSQNSTITDINKSDVVDTSVTEKETSRKMSTDSVKSKEDDDGDTSHKRKPKHLERSESVKSHEETLPNGQPPIVISRKRRWGSRPGKVTSQKSITISTDVLKEIIPDVKLTEFDEVIDEKEKKHKRIEVERVERPVLPKIVIDNTEHNNKSTAKEKENIKNKDSQLSGNRKISILKDDSITAHPPSPPRHKQSCILFISNLVRPFTLAQLKNLLQRTGRIVENGFWIDRIKSKCYVKYEDEDQAVETRHALHGVTWPVSNPKALQVDFATQDAFDKARNEEEDTKPISTIPGTVEDWIREQDIKRERGEVDAKPWERKSVREWDVGKNEKDKDKVKEGMPREGIPREERERREYPERRRHRSSERSPEPARKFKKKEEEAPAKLLDDLFKKTKLTPCIYWLPLSAETIAVKEEQRRQHMLEHERRLQELRARRRH